MEIGVREILIVIVVLVIVGILVDGFRRARQTRKNSLRMAIEKPSGEAVEDDFFRDYNPELPGGPARVIKPAEKKAVTHPTSEAAVRRTPQFDETVLSRPARVQQEIEFPQAPEQVGAEAAFEDDDADFDDENSSQALANPINQPVSVEQVIVINLAARNGQIDGENLLRVITNNGLRFGEMGLFHRMDSLSDVEGAKLFSMANMVKPGNFDVSAMTKFKTPGISLFLTLPGPRAPRGAFETMLETAQRLGSVLDCDLRDETQSALTQQTIAHYRQRVDEFCRKQISASKL